MPMSLLLPTLLPGNGIEFLTLNVSNPTDLTKESHVLLKK